MSENNKAFKAGVWYTFGNFLLKASAFITMPIFARVLSVDEMGDFSNFTSWLSILMIITTFDLYHSLEVARFDYKDDIDDFISSNLFQGMLITTICFSVIFIFRKTFFPILSIGVWELLVIYLYCLFYPSLQMFQLKCRIDYKYKSSVIISIISSISSTILSLILVINMSNHYVGRYIGYSIPAIIVNVCLFFYLIIKSNNISPKKYWKYALVISFPMIWHTLAGNVLSTSDRVMIRYFLGRNDVALYTIPYSCASIVQLLWISMNSAWSPWALEQMDKDNYDGINKALKPYALFFGAVVFAFLLVSPEVLYFMGGKAYMSALKVIPPVMISYVFNFCYSFYANMELYEKKQVYIATSTGLAAFLNVILNAIFIPFLGYVVAAYTTLIGYIALFFLHFYVCKRINKSNLINNKFLFVFLGISLLTLFIMPVLYTLSIIRYILICVLIVISIIILIILRKEIIYLIKYKSSLQINNKVSIFLKRFKHEKTRN